MRYIKIWGLTLVLMLGLFIAAQAQQTIVVTPFGDTGQKASQLVFWFSDDDSFSNTFFQLTNDSNTSGVTVHIQIWSSEFGSGDPVADPCVETNFTDTLTPNDTHVYEIGELVVKSQLKSWKCQLKSVYKYEKWIPRGKLRLRMTYWKL